MQQRIHSAERKEVFTDFVSSVSSQMFLGFPVAKSSFPLPILIYIYRNSHLKYYYHLYGDEKSSQRLWKVKLVKGEDTVCKTPLSSLW